MKAQPFPPFLRKFSGPGCRGYFVTRVVLKSRWNLKNMPNTPYSLFYHILLTFLDIFGCGHRQAHLPITFVGRHAMRVSLFWCR